MPSNSLLPPRSSNPDVRELTDTGLIKKAFLYACWNYSSPENARLLEEITLEARFRQAQNPRLLKLVKDSKSNGELAYNLAQKYVRKLKEEGNSESVQSWLWAVTSSQHESVARHLKITFEDWEEFQKLRKERWQQKNTNPKKISIPAIHLGARNEHPNSLRVMPVAGSWEILIDEAGIVFDEQVTELASHEVSKMGRFVALAIPDNKQLPPLKSGYHAKDEATQKIEQILKNLLQSKAGVFGFAANDPAMNSRSYWMSHIYHLMRWVLLLLPLQPGQTTRVSFRIEQRGSYDTQTNLQPLQEVLENEIKDLDPERFRDLKLDLAIIGKDDHPANGYVDTLANLWGSPNPFKKKLLEHTRLLGPCLLKPGNLQALERLYVALNSQRTLVPHQWYQACSHEGAEGEHSLLSSFLKRLGEQAQQSPGLWQSYLQEVKYRLSTKNYRLEHLGSALEWLERYAPAHHTIPPALELQLLAARLSLANHRGQTQPQMLARTFELTQQLQEENAPLACETLLRLAVSGTNAFQFSETQPLIEQWLAMPVAAPGLLNHGKLHSTLGQLLAFQGQASEAVASFDRALETFERLSDPEQANKEKLQTASYRLCALMDAEDLASSEQLQTTLSSYLQQVTQQQDMNEQVKSLARSGDTLNRVFAHHLLLRALVSWPQALAPLRKTYLAMREFWQEGDEHPWPLIQAYRGWLLVLEGDSQQGLALFSEAIELCEASSKGPTLQWMGAVLRRLAQALGLDIDGPSPEQQDELKQKLPQAPHAVLAQPPADPIQLLQECLPFN
ncbi:MAG: hypothetical protein IBX50_15475, partial [Marinospirillum sp.]|uniref:hypothetical protein n=1 Tax=Marinospirillum sp. TaxID=2183934 RepID=UPI0019ED67A6